MKKSQLRQIIKEEINENMDLETRNDSSIKVLKEYGWEIQLLMDELSRKKFGLKVEDWVEYNKDKYNLGPVVPIFSTLLEKLKQMEKLIK